MRKSHTTEPDRGETAEARYAPCRARVEAAYARMRAVDAGRFTPAQQRRAAAELGDALRDAREFVTDALRSVETEPAPRRFRLGRRQASRAVPPLTGKWAAELVRLGEIDVWLRRWTMDRLGVNVVSTVRVGSRAATGPHVAGLISEPESLTAATLNQPRIGVDLRAIVDRVDAGRGGDRQLPAG